MKGKKSQTLVLSKSFRWAQQYNEKSLQIHDDFEMHREKFSFRRFLLKFSHVLSVVFGRDCK